MKKSISVLLISALCLSLTGCSVGGGISSGVLVVIAVALAALAVFRGQSLAKMRRSRRMTQKQRAWLRTQTVMTNIMYIVAAVLLIIGIIVGLASCGTEDGETMETTASAGAVMATESDPTEGTEETGPDLTGIPDSLIELMKKNPETTDFVLNYCNRQPMEIDLSQIDRSAGVPLFLQWDPRWGYEIYGNDVLAITGCAPTCVAMVGYYLTGDEIFTPDQMAKFSQEDGHYNNGTNWTFIQDGIEKLGLSTTELPLAEGVMIQNLQAGNLIIINVGPGDFTTTGHYMVLVGYENGMFRINDPNSRINSEKLWSYETLEPQIRNLWAVKVG